MSGANKQNTTSIVDISEIEDDEEIALAPTNAKMEANLRPQQQQQQRPASAHLYLYHEDLHPQNRIPNLLSTMINTQRVPQAADTSPGQTLMRPASGMGGAGFGNVPAIDYHPLGDQDPGRSPNFNYADTEGGGTTTRPVTPAPEDQKPQQQSANLGTLSGVYFPCVQNIFGVILFIRMVWIVGTAGVPAAFSLVFICCCVTLTTSISLSAIATNGIVPAGGSYFMISRSLGPECGGAVGTMFFLGTTFAGAMYITGAVEIMLNYLAPSWGLFGDFQRDVNILYHNIRVYGTLLLIIVGVMVWIGVKFVSKLAPIALFCVLFSIFCIYAGIFVNYNGRPDLMICVLGDRLVTLKNIPYEEPPAYLQQDQQQEYQANNGQSLMSRGQTNASRQLSSSELASQFQLRRTRALCNYEKLSHIYCPNELAQQHSQTPEAASGDSQQQQTDHHHNQEQQRELEKVQQNSPQVLKELFARPPNMSNCDPYFHANRHRIHLEKAVPGIASGVFFENLKTRFREKRTIVSYDDGKNTNDRNDFNNVFVDLTTSFMILISIYFPSCTGILAGSNRSGDLADAQKSIPLGTLSAQLTTSFVYLSCIVLFGATFNNLFIRDKFGESMGGQLAVTQIAWPHPYVILIGGLLSTLGAALQSLVGAPRILQGIAKDEVMPCFNRFAKLSKRGEPETAIIFTLCIAWFAVLIGNLDFIAPILTLSLVMCYFFINLACAVHTLLGSPNWRPRFRHYHWSISTLGCILCLFVMIVSSLAYFFIAIFIACCIYKYIEFCGAEKEWGDGKQGLALSAARYNLLRLKTQEPHTKNWRPQVLLFCKLKPSAELEPPSAAASASQDPESHAHQATGSAAAGFADDLRVAHPRLLTFASQLKAGKGLTLVTTLIEGDFKQSAPIAQRARQSLLECMQREQVKGFPDALIAPSIKDGLSYHIQTAGLGGLKHNTVVVGWPAHWRRSATGPATTASDPATAASSHQALSLTTGQQQQQQSTSGGSAASSIPTRQFHLRNPLKANQAAPTSPNNVGQQQQQQQQQQAAATPPEMVGGGGASSKRPASTTRAHLFVELMRQVQVSQNALLVVKGVDSWPESCDKLGGFIDIWWIVNDGGLLMLLPHLLRQHRTWKSCQLRIFTVAQAGDNSVQMHEDLRKFLYHLRIEAQVHIVEMGKLLPAAAAAAAAAAAGFRSANT